jgi:hypothetical protein
VRAGAVLAALALVACAGAARQGAAGPDREEETLDDAEAPVRDAGLALLACRAALERADTAPADGQYALIAEGCADLFTLPVCGEAIRMSPAAPPELRPQMVVVACHHAYCPVFEGSEAPPALCAMRPAAMSPSELREPWGAFALAVLALELRLDDAAPELTALANDLLPALVGPRSAPASEATDAGSRPRLVVVVAREGTGYRLAADVDGEGFGPFSLTLVPNEADFAGLLEAAARRAQGGVAVLEVDADIAYGVAVELTAALRTLGITQISFAVAPSDPTATSE